ncbi:outer membrane beta-barrel protein [Cytophaga aurantiaca]|uniref:outer membrane beta-barrel protein n=1 Tax=Cytophaga aurantiaca TaxID=29530 RepID=UPI000377699C|nr:outer membrane beta-barrel protein [Cytophaga aurantiaca]
MKKILLVAGLLFCSQTIFAQLEKGMFAIGLTSAFTSNKTVNETNSSPAHYNDTRTYKSYNLAPTLSYFLTNRFAVGLSVGYAGYKDIHENTNTDIPLTQKSYFYDETTSNGTNVSPFIKYYFPLSDHFNFLLKAGFSNTFSTGKTSGYEELTNYDGAGNATSVTRSNEYGPNKTKTMDMTTGISPGVLFMPGKKIGLEFSLGNVIAYSSRTSKTTDNATGNTTKATTTGLQFFNFNTISIGTGIYYFF